MFSRDPQIVASRRLGWVLAIVIFLLSVTILIEQAVAVRSAEAGRLSAVLEWAELVLALAGLGVGARFLSQLLQQNKTLQMKLDRLGAPFAKALEQQFADWGLSEAEADVALFMVKGLSLKEIAQMRGTSDGTVKFQANAIYKKADVSGRGQLLATLIEDHL